MKNNQIPDKLSTQIDKGVKQAIALAIERHRRLGESICIWQDGKVVTITADRIPPLDLDSRCIDQTLQSNNYEWHS